METPLDTPPPKNHVRIIWSREQSNFQDLAVRPSDVTALSLEGLDPVKHPRASIVFWCWRVLRREFPDKLEYDPRNPDPGWLQLRDQAEAFDIGDQEDDIPLPIGEPQSSPSP